MESGGIPGAVHISHETYINLANSLDEILIEEGNGGTRDSLLKERKIKTYLIRPKLENKSSILKYKI